jgi:hypothetical protein
VFDVVVVGVEVPEAAQLFLKCPQGIQIVLPRAAGLDVSILEEGVDARAAGVPELAVRGIEFLLGELAGLGEEQAHEDIAPT